MDLVIVGSSIAAEGLSRFERSLFDPFFRLFLIAAGSVGVVAALWGIWRHVARFFGKGRPLRVDLHAQRQFGGDVDKARSSSRAAFPSGIAGLGIGAALIALGLADPYDAGFRDQLMIGFLLYVGIFGLWAWIEYEFAWPGVFVAKDVRGTPGMRAVRRSRRTASR